MTKKTLRSKYKKLRKSLTHDTVRTFNLSVYDSFFTSINPKFKTYHVYLSTDYEVCTRKIIATLLDNGKKVFIPKITHSQQMDAVAYTQKTIVEKNKYNILEPQNENRIDSLLLDAVITPLLAIDVNGNRIGYGGGYYDRFFKKCRADVCKIGLGFFLPEKKLFPAESHDVSLDMYLSPQGITYFENK